MAITRWMPTARAIWAMRVIESSTSRAATIMRSFSSSMITTMNGSRSTFSEPGSGSSSPLFKAAL